MFRRIIPHATHTMRWAQERSGPNYKRCSRCGVGDSEQLIAEPCSAFDTAADRMFATIAEINRQFKK